MARAPQPSPFDDDYSDDSKTIWAEPAGIIIWPNWKIFQQCKRDYERNPGDPSWDELLLQTPRLFSEPLTHDNFAEWREKQIQLYVEAGCQPLVRHILDKGYFTFYSNAYGHGTKGVGFTKGVFDFNDTRSGYFYFLKDWDTNPKITTVANVSFGTLRCDEPDAKQNEKLKKRLGFSALTASTQPASVQPAVTPERPAKAKRKTKQKRDRAPGDGE